MLIHTWAYDKLFYTLFYQGNFLQKIYNYSAIDVVKAVSGCFARRSFARQQFAQIKSIRPKRIIRSLKKKNKKKQKG